MHENSFNKREFIFGLSVSLFILLILLFLVNRNPTVTFCDVGQGDASYIQLPNNIDILIDLGRNSSVLNCIGKRMPYYDKSIEAVFISHAQIDHYGGLRYLKDRYDIENVFISNPESDRFTQLLTELKSGNTAVQEIFSGDTIVFEEAVIELYWPEDAREKAERQAPDPNESSQVMRFTYGSTTILYSGDASPVILNRLSRQSIPKATILKVPHHGSVNGLTENFLILADPEYAVISSGKNNNYGHPSPQILKLLQNYDVEILRTDLLGDITFTLR